MLFSDAVQNEIGAGNLPASYLTGSTYNRFTRYAAGNRADWENGEIDTDWQAEAFQKAPMGQFDLSASGGDEKTRFFVSGQYLDQKGILVSNTLSA